MLGTLDVRADDGTEVVVPGARLRALLIVLALEPGRVVSTARLVDGIWGDRPPEQAANALQGLVSRLRRAVPGMVVEARPNGYRLVIEPDSVDVARFESLVAVGRSAPARDAARILREALDLWRGPVLLDVAGQDFFAAPLARLSELWLAAVEDRVDADLRLGHLPELVGELTSLVAEHPVRERLVGALMRALCAAGRSADALTLYERTREALAESLGADPSPELSALHTEVLRGTTPVSDVEERPRTNLRAALTSFVGRDADLAQVGKLVGEYRLTTLIGPGGAGKTRLASETARAVLDQMSDQTRDGVWLVELAPVATDADLPQAVLAALGVREQALNGTPADRLATALSTRKALLVLDNCEHVVGAAAALAERLLGECPGLRILATSREPLGITGEALWPVEPLALPPQDAGMAESLSYAAVRLLNDRARAARPGFEVTATAVRICRALDGMPLAIELAAARLRTMTAEQLAGRLDDRFRLLTGGSRTALPRHQTLRAVIDWSWDLLTGPERALLRRLAVFSRGASVDAVEHVCTDELVAASHVPELLSALADKSLLLVVGDDRYGMLETIKEYGLRRLDEAGERDTVRQAHAAYFVRLAETADPHLRRASQLIWLDRLAADHGNIDTALRGAIAAGDARTAVRLVAAAGWYWLLEWWLRGRKTEGAKLAEAALAMPGDVDDEARATACALSALFNLVGNGDEQKAAEWSATARQLVGGTERRHPILRLIGPVDGALWGSGDTDEDVTEDPWVHAMAQTSRALSEVSTGRRHEEAEADLLVALTAFRTVGDRWAISYCLTNLAELVAWRGDLAAAVGYHVQAIAVVTEVVPREDTWKLRLRLAQLRWQLGDREGAAEAVAVTERDAERIGSPDVFVAVAYGKAELARWSGDSPAARTHLAHVGTMSGHMALNWPFRAMVLDSLAYLDTMDGDLEAARAHRADALTWALRSRYAPSIAQILVGVADLALGQGRPREAARLLAASVSVRGMPDRSLPDAVRVEEAARAALSEQEFAEAAARGHGTTIETARQTTAVILDGLSE
jgi:predicted ATPase/DNA-binding SARP family transcriptional activator